MAYIDPWGGYAEGMQHLTTTLKDMSEQDQKQRLQQLQEEKARIELDEAKRVQAAKRGLAGVIARTQETTPVDVTTQTENPAWTEWEAKRQLAAPAFKAEFARNAPYVTNEEALAQPGLSEAAKQFIRTQRANTPDTEEEAAQKSLESLARYGESPAMASPESYAAYKYVQENPNAPEKMLSQTTTTQMPKYNPFQRNAMIVGHLVQNGLIEEASKYQTLTKEQVAEAGSIGKQFADLYVKTGGDLGLTKRLAVQQMEAMGFDTKSAEQNADKLVQMATGPTLRTVTNPLTGESIIIGPGNKIVSPTSLESTANKEKIKAGYKSQLLAEQARYKEAAATVLFDRNMKRDAARAQYSKELKQIMPGLNDAAVSQLADMAEHGRLPPKINSRTAPIYAALDKATGGGVNFNTLEADNAAAKRLTQLHTVMMANEKDANLNFDRLERLLPTLNNTSLPMWNSLINRIEKGLGAPAPGTTEAVAYEALTRYAKVVNAQTTGQAVTDTAAQGARELLNVLKDNPELAAAKIKQFRGMMADNTKAYGETINSLTYGASGKAPVAGKQPVLSPAVESTISASIAKLPSSADGVPYEKGKTARYSPSKGVQIPIVFNGTRWVRQ